MLIVATLACVLGVQDVRVAPPDAVVGSPLTVTVLRNGAPVAGVEVAVEASDGAMRAIGPTGADGVVRYTPEEAGAFGFVATVDGVRCVAAVAVAPSRHGWWLAFGSVPLGMSLLWMHLRSAARRDLRPAPDVRPAPDRRVP